jgi:spermidine dehydrogenase
MGWLANRLSDLAGTFVIGDAPLAYMFPDGNASVARLLVQKLIPDVSPAMKGFEDVATARFNYAALDRENNSTRLRLNSTVVGVKEIVVDQVKVDYVQHGRPLSITATHCVLACYNGIIPHLCPEMSEQQKKALSYGIKVPFVYANVLLKNGRAFAGLGATFTQCPYDPFQWVSAAPTMTTGGYQPPQSGDQPMAVFMMASPTPANVKDVSARELFRIGRHSIYGTSFDAYEQQIREQLQGLLGVHGFDHQRDIIAITVNRIPHGYAYSYLALDDPDWEDGQAPHEIGRAQFGRISIANSDAEAMPLMQAAFDAAWRAVQEQTA